MMRSLLTLLAALTFWAMPATAQQDGGPLRLEITEGVIEPMPFAVPDLVAESAQARDFASRIARVIAADLSGTGLFREIPAEAHIGRITSFDSPVQFADWRAVNAQALVTGAVSVDGAGRLVVKFRIHDVFAGQELGRGQQLVGDADGWRRIAHKVADQVYSRITGEGGYFDSRVVFVAESGPKDKRAKRLAIMDYDGANLRYLTDASTIVLAPRFSPTGDRVLYTSYEGGFPRIYLLDVADVGRRVLPTLDGTMSFAPRFSPDGRTVVYSLTQGGNTDLYTMDIASGASTRLTTAPSIETAPSYSPDGRRIVFESDRSGTRNSTSWRPVAARRSGSASARGAMARRCGRRAAISSPSPSRPRAAFTSASCAPMAARNACSPPRSSTRGRHGPPMAGSSCSPARRGAARRGAALYRGHHRAQPAAGADNRRRERSRVGAAPGLKTP